jgi:pilus assembly protein CpaE
MAKITVQICGEEQALCDAMRAMLGGHPDIQTSTQVRRGEAAAPATHPAVQFDVQIVLLGAHPEDTLRALSALPASQRSAMIVVGHDSDVKLMRQAMQAGARDYFAPPVMRAELIEAVRKIGSEKRQDVPATLGSLTAVINARGGSGASFIAVNLAHSLALRHKAPVALVDMDLQFGSLPLALDVEQKNSLLTALAASEQIDGMALGGYMAKHGSGVHVLSAMSEQLPTITDVSADALRRVLTVVRQSYPRVIADLPRQLDALTSTVLAQADHVVLVMQQSLAHVRDAKRMLQAIGGAFGNVRNNVVLVVNRYNKNDVVTLKDITEAIAPPALVTLPNDFRTVSESLNRGVPLLDFARNAAITQALQDLASSLYREGAQETAPERRGFRATIAHSLGA